MEEDKGSDKEALLYLTPCPSIPHTYHLGIHTEEVVD